METIDVSRDDRGIVTVTLDRPHRKNAIDATMWNELLATFREIAENGDDRAVVITGNGGAFCSGADLGSQKRERAQFFSMKHVSDVAIALHRLPQPTIAKVRGVAVGAGLNLALACDLIVASENARFSEIFARRGLSVDFGGSWLLPRLVGLHRAKQLVLLADIIDAGEAQSMGLVNKVVPDDALDAAADEWAAKLAAGPPIALAQSKELLNEGLGRSMAQALDAEGMAQSVNFATEDTAEAVKAFLDKRDPVFHGR